jgi:hypothetical protein
MDDITVIDMFPDPDRDDDEDDFVDYPSTDDDDADDTYSDATDVGEEEVDDLADEEFEATTDPWATLSSAVRYDLANVTCTPKIHCKAFEDNSGTLTMAQIPKMRPRTKHLNVKYHHFRDHVARGEISLHAIASANQEADIYTKPLSLTLFERFRLAIFGW